MNLKILLLIIPFQSFAQIDSSLIGRANQCILTRFDTSECLKGIDAANKQFNDGPYFIWNIGIWTPCPMKTFAYLCEYKYKLRPLGGSDLMNSRNCCYYAQSQLRLEKRKGKNFLDKVTFEADSLDKLGIGYNPPEFTFKEMNIFEFAIKKILPNLDLDTLNYFNYKMQIKIDTNGNCSYHFVNNETDEITQDNLTEIFRQSIGEIPNWKPAKIYGSPIEMEYILPIRTDMIEVFSP